MLQVQFRDGVLSSLSAVYGMLHPPYSTEVQPAAQMQKLYFCRILIATRRVAVLEAVGKG